MVLGKCFAIHLSFLPQPCIIKFSWKSTLSFPNNTIETSMAQKPEIMSVSKHHELPAEAFAYELGVWLLALNSFLQTRNHPFADGNFGKAIQHDWKPEIGLIRWGILRLLELTWLLSDNLPKDADKSNKLKDITLDELVKLAATWQEIEIICQSSLNSANIDFQTWTAFCHVLSEKFDNIEIVIHLNEFAQKKAEENLPESLKGLLDTPTVSPLYKPELKTIFSQMARLLSWLQVIEKMMNEDQPLKPVLILFCLINEQTRELLNFLPHQILNYLNEEDTLFDVLDGMSYVTSMELRRTFNQELINFSELRPAPLIFARTETAYGLLNDCFQQSVVVLAQFFDPTLESINVFPNLKTKLQQSIVLRQELWNILQIVKKAEKSPEDFPIETVKENLSEFRQNALRYLMYKDWETMERFVEEISQTRHTESIVSVLHRFGAYVETLFGQVNMRTVLANHPFEYD